MNITQVFLFIVMLFAVSCSVTNDAVTSTEQAAPQQNKASLRSEAIRDFRLKDKHAASIEEGLGAGETVNCIDETLKNSSMRCPDVDEPVCGCDGTTYKNSCEAQKAGVKFYSKGGCNK